MVDLGLLRAQDVLIFPDEFEEPPAMVEIEEDQPRARQAEAPRARRVADAGAEVVDVDWYPEIPEDVELRLDDYRRRVLTHNETIQIHLLGVLVAEKNYKAARAVFEPEYVATHEHVVSSRPNTAEEKRNLDGLDVFNERNNLSTNGIEMLTPSNARVRLGTNLFELQNNIQDREPKEYSTFLGANVTQPLLRNAGTTASMASIRLAAFESELAFQEYRRQMMVTIAAAESAYWNVFYASQQLKFSRESLAMAKSLHADLAMALEAGKVTPIEVMSAKVGVLERESNLSVASQRMFEANNLMISYFSAEPPQGSDEIAVTEVPPPPPTSIALDRDTEFKMAIHFNPDYLRRVKEGEMADLRVMYAKNQARPQIDLLGSYGLNGLGGNPGASFDDIWDGEYPVWTVGVEMRVPLAGGRALQNQLDAAKLRKLQALLGLKQVEVQLYTAVDNVLRKAESTLASFGAHRAAVGLNEHLLKDARMSLDAGRIDIRTIFEIEQDLFESKETALRDIVEYQNAKLERELVTGMVFFNRNWEVARTELQRDSRGNLKSQTNKQTYDENSASIPDLPAVGAGSAPVRRGPESGEPRGAAAEPAARERGGLFRRIFSRD